MNIVHIGQSRFSTILQIRRRLEVDRFCSSQLRWWRYWPKLPKIPEVRNESVCQVCLKRPIKNFSRSLKTADHSFFGPASILSSPPFIFIIRSLIQMRGNQPAKCFPSDSFSTLSPLGLQSISSVFCFSVSSVLYFLHNGRPRISWTCSQRRGSFLPASNIFTVSQTTSQSHQRFSISQSWFSRQRVQVLLRWSRARVPLMVKKRNRGPPPGARVFLTYTASLSVPEPWVEVEVRRLTVKAVVWECGGLQVWLVQKREAASHNCRYDIALSSLGSKCCCSHSCLCWNLNITEWWSRHP